MPKKKYNAFYAQSGGVTAVINATACGVIETARKSLNINKVYAGRNGIIGALREELIDTSKETKKDIAALKHTPSGAFGSCRYKLKSLEENKAEYERLIEVFKAHDIRYFFYNGGGDSQDTAHKVSQLSEKMGFRLLVSVFQKPWITIYRSLTTAQASARWLSTSRFRFAKRRLTLSRWRKARLKFS